MRFVTGRGQGVLVHVDVGTANTANAMHNVYRSRLPVLLMAGKAPYTANDELVGSRDTYVHFVQEPFDQASLVRPYLTSEKVTRKSIPNPGKCTTPPFRTRFQNST